MSLGTGLSPKEKTLVDRVYDAIKDDIINTELTPGQLLLVQELAAKHGVSKTPVRDALNRLSQENLVTILPRRGYLVSTFTIQDVQDFFSLRLILETTAVRMAAVNITPPELENLQTLADRKYVFEDKNSYRTYFEENREFHVAVAQASGNRMLAELIGNLLDQMRRILYTGLKLRDSSEEMAAEHRELIESFKNRDPLKAQEVVERTINNARQRVMDGIQGPSTWK